MTAVAGAAAAATPAPAPTSPRPLIAAAAADTEQPLVESISDIGQEEGAGGGAAGGVSLVSGGAAVDAKVMLRRAGGKGVNPGSFMGLMLATRDSSTGKPFPDDVVSC